ncbi:MAG TPA: Na/Pi cotransporter family protein [Myxococcota bacterium]|nr:Na/Pi cotransporter family protein [Myxococcota bacterium]
MEISWLAVGMGLFGGLALFLSGLEQLSDALKQAAGASLRTVLARLTTNRVAAALTGAVVTGILNSSSVTTVLVVGFVTAGVMTLQQSVGVIMGANIGSTVTAQLLAFNLAEYALAPVAVGFFMSFASARERVQQYGKMLMGLGLVFFGMGVMGEAMRPLRSYPPFVDALASMDRPLLGMLAGALFTALVQSSAATMGLAIALASEGLLSLPGGLALALGANIGTCATALLAAIGKPVPAVRAAVVHLAFNVIGALLWLPLLPLLAALAVRVSPSEPGLEGLARAAAEVPRQLANANTLFNVVNTVLFLPFTALFARLAEFLVRDRPDAAGAAIRPEFLDDAALVAPDLALGRARQETARVGGLARDMLAEFGAALRDRDEEHLVKIARHAVEARELQGAILGYLGRLRQEALSQGGAREVQELMEAVFGFDSLARLVADDLVELARQAQELRKPSPETMDLLRELYGTVSEAVAIAVRALGGPDAGAASQVLALREPVEAQRRSFLARQATRLRPDDPDYLALMRIQVATVDKLRRIFELARRVAEQVPARAG